MAGMAWHLRFDSKAGRAASHALHELRKTLRADRIRDAIKPRRYRSVFAWPDCKRCGQSMTGVYGGVVSCVRCPASKAAL